MSDASGPSTPAPPDLSHVHAVTEDHAWSENVPDHGGRVETPVFSRAKAFVHKLIAAGAATPWGPAAGPGDMQMHHSGSIWVFDGKGWQVFLNAHGSEYSGQFMIDPAKLELLSRLPAVWLVSRFPETLDEMDRLGYHDGRKILNTPIVDAQTISDYVDSVWNSQAPIPSRFHTGVLSSKSQGAGEHHYPKAVTDMQHLKYDDFVLWHVDPASGTPVAVSPTAPRGSGIGSVKVEYAQEGTALHAQHLAARGAGKALVLPADHPLAQAAFAKQA